MSLTIPNPGQTWVHLNNDGKIASSVFYASEPDAPVIRFDSHQQIYTPGPSEVFHKADNWVTVVLYDNGSVKTYESENAAGDHVLLNFGLGSAPSDTTFFGFDDSLSFGPLVSSNITSSIDKTDITQEFSNGHLTHYVMTSTEPGNSFRLEGAYHPDAIGGADPKVLVSLHTNGGQAVEALADTGNFDKLRLITNDGGSLITNDGGSLITNDGGSLKLISNDGASLITNDGGSLITNDGGSLSGLSIDQLIGKNAAKIISNDGASIVSTSGSGVIEPGSLFDANGLLDAVNASPDPDALASVNLSANLISALGSGFHQYKTLSVDEGSGTAPGSDADSAVAVTLGNAVSGSLAENGDAVWYAVTLTAGQKYVFNLLGASSSDGTLGDPALKLLDAATVFVASADDGGAGSNSKLIYEATSSGTYYLVARAYNDAGNGSFKLLANVEAPNPEILSNGGGATATIDVDEGLTASDANSISIIQAWDDQDGNTLTYTLEQSGDYQDFDLNPGNGILSFHLPIDFENPHDSNLDNSYSITVIATDGDGHTDSQAMTVNVHDLPELIYGTSDNDTLDATHAGAGGAFATTGANWMFGLGGNDSMDAGAGDDSLVGGAGDDIIIGGAGNDTATFGGNSSAYTISAYDPFEDGYTITGTDGVDVLRGVEHLVFDNGEAGFGLIVGTTGIESINGTGGDDVINPLTGAGDEVNGLGGTDRLYLDWSALTQGVTFVVNAVSGPGGTTTFYSVREGSAGPNEVFYLNIEAFTIHGSLTAANTLTTGTENTDVYFGGIAGDSFATAGGDDVVDIGLSQATGVASAIDTVNLGAGTGDLLIANYQAATEAVSFGYFTHDSNAGGLETEYRSNGNDGVTIGAVSRLNFSGVERFHVTGGSQNDTIVTGDGGDTIIGQEGNDTLNSGRGYASIDGGSGVDLWQANLSLLGTGVTLSFADPSVMQTLSDGSQIVNIERVGLIGTVLADSIVMSATFAAGDNTFSTGDGADTVTIYGGPLASNSGLNTVNLGTGTGDLLIANYGAATEAVNFGYFTHDSNAGGLETEYRSNGNDGVTIGGVNRLNFSGVERFYVTGGATADSLESGDHADTLIGNGGDDTLNSGYGRASIDGGTGNDLWRANLLGTGIGASATLSFADPSVTQTLTDGSTIRNIEHVDLIGTTLGDAITMGASYGALANSFDMRDGNDTVTIYGNTMSGNSGLNTVNLGAGTGDLLIANYGAATEAVNFGYFTHDSNAGGLGTEYRSNGNDGVTIGGVNRLNFSGVERFYVTGGSNDDSLESGDHADTLVGNGGNDTLDSGRGKASIDGGTGVDLWKANLSLLTSGITLDISNPATEQTLTDGSTVLNIERLGLTTTSLADRIVLSSTFAAQANQITTLDGDDTVTIYGNTTNANSGLNTVNLGLGAGDLLIASYGAATEAVSFGYFTHDSNAGGLGTEYRSNGDDGVTIGAVSRLNFSGVERFYVTGGSNDDSLESGDHADTLVGNGGNDTLDSGRGKASIDGGTGVDLWKADLSMLGTGVTLDLTTPATVQTFSDGSTIANIERLSLTGTNFDDVITLGMSSAAFDSTVNGADGNDTVTVRGTATGASSGTNTVNLGSGAGNDLLVADYSAATEAVSFGYFTHDSNSGGVATEYRSNGADGAVVGGANRLNFSGVERFSIVTGSGADSITTGDGADTIKGGAGNDTVNAGDGDDTVVYSGHWYDYSFAVSGTDVTVTDNRSGANDGVDVIHHAEHFQFSNGTASLAGLANVAPTDLMLAGSSVVENAANATVVGTLSTTDGNGALDQFIYSLTGNAGGRFAISGSHLVVANGALLDFEASASHAVTVHVTDAHGLAYDEAFNIAVSNSNEHIGAISDTNHAASRIAENAGKGVAVGITAHAADPDTADHPVHYRLDSNGHGHFAIDANTGVVKTSSDNIDREADGTSFTIVVRVTSPDASFTTKSFVIAVDNAKGSTIEGSSHGDHIDATHTVTGQHKPTIEEDKISGKGGDDTINALDGNDVIDGGTGKDRMTGGRGDDTYTIDNAGDIADETGGNGTDLVKSSVTFSLADAAHAKGAIEQLTLTGGGAIDGTGNGSANVITGGTGANLLTGNAGNDTMNGGNGNDTLLGGAGMDSLSGGAGKDIFKFTALGDSGAAPNTRDIITDFTHGSDRLDLSKIDARTTSGDQSFALDHKGSASTAVAQGHIGWYWEDNAGAANDHTILKLNNDTDPTIESTIQLNGLLNLVAADFML